MAFHTSFRNHYPGTRMQTKGQSADHSNVLTASVETTRQFVCRVMISPFLKIDLTATFKKSQQY